MKQLIFATNNQHKLLEVEALIGADFQILSLKQAGINCDIPEDCHTLEGNAIQKARFVNKLVGANCFADDTGLEVEALNNQPGVFSARYAGQQRNSKDNVKKLLHNMLHQQNRNARFRTVIALIMDQHEYLFEGIVNGTIGYQEVGTDGFGYDPIFVPQGQNLTFAQMPLQQKNLISHRARAMAKLLQFLKQY